MRWRDHVLLRGDAFESFWVEHGQETNRRNLFLVGRGFDPRTPLGLSRVAALSSKCPIDLIGLEFQGESSGTSTGQQEASEYNWSAMTKLVANRGTVNSRPVRFRSDDGRRIAARSAANVLPDSNSIDGYTDIIIDVSAMPRVVYFPLIGRVLYYHDTRLALGQTAPNVHVVVSEDPSLDALVEEHGIDETASFLPPFEGPFNREALGNHPTVWIPVLGKGRTTQFDRIYDWVKPTEVCPVLPSPARNPRLSDDIIMEYQNLLFDQARIDPRGIIYASEFNPFDVYRQARRTVLHYNRVLGLIGGCRVALSAMCSKVMSLGTLLVAYEFKSSDLEVGIAHIECEGYTMPLDAKPDVAFVGVWIAGDCYRKD